MSTSIHQLPPRQQALHFIAAYDNEHAQTEERHLVDIAERWLILISNPHYAEGVVSDILADFDHANHDSYPTGWRDLIECFTQWARREEYL